MLICRCGTHIQCVRFALCDTSIVIDIMIALIAIIDETNRSSSARSESRYTKCMVGVKQQRFTPFSE